MAHRAFCLPKIFISTLLYCALSSTTFAEKSAKELPLDELQRFTAVVEQIRKYYVEPVDDKKLFENAIRGMLSGLDPHSSYLDQNEFSDLKVSTSGKFGGLGIEVTMEDGYVRVISPIDDTPAQRAGIQAGDLIVRLDETPVKGLTLRKAVDIMRGEKGSPITLTILRKGATAPLKYKVTRDTIIVKSVRSKVVDNHYGYLRVSQFQSQSGEDLLNAIQNLKKETNNDLRGVILDLRNNPGGILESSVKISDLFLDKPKLGYNGLIVYTEGRLPGSEIKEYADAGDELKGAPIVVLVNGGSASASEIVAGALQDHKRAVIVGTQTFGKGSVQTVLPLKDNHGLKLTTALYYTPSGRSIQAMGIVPDIIIPDLKIPEAKVKEEEDWISVKEADLQGHLANATTKKDETVKQPEKTPDKNSMFDASKPLINQDYQLNEALNLLKGLVLTQSKNGQHREMLKNNNNLKIPATQEAH